MNNIKKKVEIIATVCFPIEIGKIAVLNAVNDGIVRTSPVEKLMSNSKRCVKFETRNSVYIVKPYRQSLFSKVLEVLRSIKLRSAK